MENFFKQWMEKDGAIKTQPYLALRESWGVATMFNGVRFEHGMENIFAIFHVKCLDKTFVNEAARQEYGVHVHTLSTGGGITIDYLNLCVLKTMFVNIYRNVIFASAGSGSGFLIFVDCGDPLREPVLMCHCGQCILPTALPSPIPFEPPHIVTAADGHSNFPGTDNATIFYSAVILFRGIMCLKGTFKIFITFRIFIAGLIPPATVYYTPDAVPATSVDYTGHATSGTSESFGSISTGAHSDRVPSHTSSAVLPALGIVYLSPRLIVDPPAPSMERLKIYYLRFISNRNMCIILTNRDKKE